MSTKFAVRATAWLVLAGLFSTLSVAQQTGQTGSSDAGAQAQAPAQNQATPPTPQSPADKNNDKGDKDKAQQNTAGPGKDAGTSKDRLFYTLPNFLTLEKGSKLPPLTAKEKFTVVALGAFDPVQYPWWGLLSAIGQAQKSEPAYGQGWAAYGKRYGTTAADSTIENFMVGAVFPSLLRQDPRYYQSGQGGLARRTGYATSRMVVTRSDSGHSQFNFSEIVGSGMSAAISTYSYHPRSAVINGKFVGSDRTLMNGGSVWLTQLGLDTFTLAVKEFWPDIHRKMSHKAKSDAAAPEGSKP